MQHEERVPTVSPESEPGVHRSATAVHEEFSPTPLDVSTLPDTETADALYEQVLNKVLGRAGTERIVRRALHEHHVRVEYQPIIDLTTGHAVSAEALARISDPASGLLRPDAFLEVAEEVGLAATVDQHVFAAALRQAAEWQARFRKSGALGVNVNTAAPYLADRNAVHDLIDTLDTQGIPRNHLQVEVTERTLLGADVETLRGLHALREAGIAVGLDDFGTGYSSLSCLRQFPIDFVKIDVSCTRELANEQAAGGMVEGIVNMAHALGLAVVAEGIETRRQLERLAEIGCDRGQGYLLGHPTRADGLEQLIVEDLPLFHPSAPQIESVPPCVFWG